MGAAKTVLGKANGYGRKQTVRIMTVDKERSRVECSLRDGGMIYAAIWETPTVFRWPEVGEIWTVREDTGIWRLDQQLQTEIEEDESKSTPIDLITLGEGETRIQGEVVHANSIASSEVTVSTSFKAPGFHFDYGLMEVAELEEIEEPAIQSRAQLVISSEGIVWNLLADGDPTESGYPWAKVGGPPLFATTIGVSDFTNNSPDGTGMPSITSPIAMKAYISYGAAYAQTRNVGGCQINLTSYVGGVQKHFSPYIAFTQFSTTPLGAQFYTTTVAKSALVQVARHVEVSQTGSVNTPFTKLDPIRVG